MVNNNPTNTKRSTIKLLPGYLQTEPLTKVFSATVDQLFQPESVEFLSGYIGNKPSWYNPTTHFYISEPTANRTNYQLAPTIISKPYLQPELSNAMFYEDLLGQLNFQGALINNHNRLFEQEYYSWSPPIDVDKFINYTKYYWLPTGPDAIKLIGSTDLENDLNGKTAFSYVGTVLYTATNTTETFDSANPLVFTNGLKIMPMFDATSTLNGNEYIIEGVGKSIQLVSIGNLTETNWDTYGWSESGWDSQLYSTTIDYITVSRASLDKNQWSNSNRWFHIDVIKMSKSLADLFPSQAFRPIIEFDANIVLWNYGTNNRGIVDIITYDSELSDVLGTIAGQTSYSIDGIPLQDGMRIIALGDTTGNANKIFKVSGPITTTSTISYTTTNNSTTTFSTSPFDQTNSTIQVFLNNQYLDPSNYTWNNTTIILNTTPNTGTVVSIVGITTSAIQLTVDTFGSINGDGLPFYGDRASVNFGSFQGKNIFYDGTVWVASKQQKVPYIPPLFQLYDTNGNSMDDPSVYPNSSFAGSNVFSYSIDPSQPIDPYVGLQLELDQYGDWIFNNNLATDVVTYTSNSLISSYVGYMFAAIGTNSNFEYSNGWHKAPNSSRQYIVNEFTVSNGATSFTLDQTPATQIANTLPNVIVFQITSDQIEKLLINNVDYVVTNNILSLNSAVSDGTRLVVKTWNPISSGAVNGYYELPLNITANPNNLPILTASRSQFLQQFVNIISNQTGITGIPLGANNYRDTARQRGLGLSILQHRAPMVKLGLINSVKLTDINTTSSPTDPIQSINYAERSYTRFYNKFLRALFTLASQQGFTASSDPTVCNPYDIELWITTALTQINIGKTPSSPWANSGPDGLLGSYGLTKSTNPSYVPTTATRLGIMPAYQPVVFFDFSYTTPQLSIQTHDGSRIVMVDSQGAQLGTILHDQLSTTNPEQLTHPVAASWLQFELNLFNNMPLEYSNSEAILAFDVREYVPGKWRSTEYSRLEYLGLLQGPFDRWVVNNQVDATTNTTFQNGNQFTYNYRNVGDKDGMPVPGHWQGIYMWFYDTDRPHTNPWEMLGFSQKPSWWDAQYGPAPYTDGNTALWEDLTNGIIRQGPRAGTYTAWARAGLMSCIPVDSQGNLKSPYEAGCVAYIPSVQDAQEPWIFGDGGPIETTWRHSQDYNFVQAALGYVMKPAKFVEYTWDSLRTFEVSSSADSTQWVYVDTNSRRSSTQFYVHREDPSKLITGTTVPNESNLTYFGSAGFEHWISEYVVSQGYDVTNYFGNILRGGDVKLAHRMAGYVNSDSFRALVDSFGQIGYNSQIIPSDNIKVYLYRSTSIGLSVYSGVVIEQVADGWKIFGYNPSNPTFTIIPSNIYGPKNTIVIGNQRVIEYQNGINSTDTIPYNTILTTYQMVYDFLISYGRWLSTQGWEFDTFNTDSSTMLNWSQSAKEFLLWAQGSWQDGTFITLSPSADAVVYKSTYGNVQYVNGIVAGTYPVVDRAGSPIQQQNIDVLRTNDSITIRPTNSQGVYGLRLFTTTLEHAVFIDNESSFGDIIYQPLYNLQQDRIKIYAYRVNDWNGKIDAPGYIIIQDSSTINGQAITSNTWTITSNFEKSANDFTRYFNIEEPKNYDVYKSAGSTVTYASTLGAVDNKNLSNLAKHLIAYQSRDYLVNLLFDDSVEFEFYQGFIKQKGSSSVVDALLRSANVIPTGSTFNYYDEWLIRVGAYGSTNNDNQIEYILPQTSVVNDPQWIRLFDTNNDGKNDDIFDIIPNDNLILTPPKTYSSDIFKLRSSYKSNPTTDISTAGYVAVGETTWYVLDTDSLLTLYSSNNSTSNPVKARDTVWQIITGNGSWMVWILVSAISQPSYTIPSTVSGDPTTIVTSDSHGLLNGDICVISNISGVPQINDTYVITGVTPNTFQINLSTFSAGTGGNILVYRPLRFANIFDRDSSQPPGGWVDGDLAYVDQGDVDAEAWTVYIYESNSWYVYRQQNLKVDDTLITSSQIFNVNTKTKLANLNYYDPAKGRIPGRADAEISYKTDYDPALYNSGNSSSFLINDTLAWGSAQLGLVWWDLSAVRYIDYEQGSDRYRTQQWGKIAPGTSVDVYEWVRSSVPPTEWASYVAEGASITVNSNSIVPSGYVKSVTNWSEVVEYDNQGVATQYYYFWVANSSIPPSIPSRSLPTQGIANLILNPNLDSIPWYAAIDVNSIILGNARGLLFGNQVAQQINYTAAKTNGNIYSEWELIRQGDPASPINPNAWSKMKDSLICFDGLNNDVPNYKLSKYNAYGTSIRPRQSWFEDRESAGKLFIDTFNQLLANSNTPFVYDSNNASWILYFNAAEPVPEQLNNWDYRVQDLSQRDLLVNAIGVGQKVLVLQTVATNNLWTIWKYLGPAGQNNWQLTRQQTYNTANYWEYVDWYLSGYSSETIPSSTVETIAILESTSSPTIGQITKVSNGGDGKWQLYVYTTTGWSLIGQQDGSILVKPSIYQWQETFGGFDNTIFENSSFDQTSAIEFGYIIDGIRYAIYATPNSIELNTLFFAMINYVVAEQVNVDWIIKTSSMVFTGFNQELTSSAILAVDNTDSLLSFINEAKPYRSKIRQFVTGKSYTDQSNWALRDFDVPLSKLTAPTIDGGEPLPPSTISTDVSNTEYQSYYDTYSSWYNNYLPSSGLVAQQYIDPSLVRNLKTTILFDRVSSPVLFPGWGSSWNTLGWNVENNITYGAVTRIFDHYQPTAGMIPKVISELMVGSLYRGMNITGLGLGFQPGWGVGPWDEILSWDADERAIEECLDQIIQGGVVPRYDSAIGTGNITSFPLLHTAVNPNDMVVWADGKIKTYGVDYIIPTFATSIYIVDGGSNYQIGDQLEIITGTYLATVRLRVTGVNRGSITSLEIVGRGSYSIVTAGPYQATYVISSLGNGSNAAIGVNWDCSNISFTVAPASSPVPNVYVLYVGTTFEGAPDNDSDTIYEGNDFVQPSIDENHPEELFPLRAADGTLMTVKTVANSGRPLVSTRIYETDGVTDQYDLLITPQNDQAVMAWLNGVFLTPGIGGDFVINYDTHKMVFINPPAAGLKLYITSIGVGGTYSTHRYIGDGVTTIFYVPILVPDINRYMAVVNGVAVEIASLYQTGVGLAVAPAYGDIVYIYQFDADGYSQVVETMITVTNPSVLTYTLNAIPGDSQPPYASTMVRNNGLLMTPPLLQNLPTDGYQDIWALSSDIAAVIGSSTISVYVDNSITTAYSITNQLGTYYITLSQPPLKSAIVTVLCVTSTTEYTITGQYITFLNGSIATNDQIIVTTYTKDTAYGFVTDEFDANSTGLYQLSEMPYDVNTIQVWSNGNLRIPNIDYSLETVSFTAGWNGTGWNMNTWNENIPESMMLNIPNGQTKIIVNYMTGLPSKPNIAWITAIDKNKSLSTVIDAARETFIISDVNTYSTSIEVADYTVLSKPNLGYLGYVYINNELIGFSEIQLAPTALYPNRAFLTKLKRNQFGTSGNPTDLYNVQYFNGDGVRTSFPTESATESLGTSVFVNNVLQSSTQYSVVIEPGGSFIVFVTPPPVGTYNIRAVYLNKSSINSYVSHLANTTVLDAGYNVQIPGGYVWEPAALGLQYNRTPLADFLIEHSNG